MTTKIIRITKSVKCGMVASGLLAMAAVTTLACVATASNPCPQNPPGHTGCLNLNGDGTTYDTLTYPETGASNATVEAAAICCYDCPGDADGTYFGARYSLSGTCP
ncbi:MAG: hypothetical protein ACREFR_00985 [Limisphaerales bacterium]